MDYNKKQRTMFNEDEVAELIENAVKVTEKKCKIRVKYYVSTAIYSMCFIYLIFDVCRTIRRWLDMSYPIYRHSTLEYGILVTFAISVAYSTYLLKRYPTELDLPPEDCDI